MPTQIACFRNAANLPKEIDEAIAKAERQGTDVKNEHARILIEKFRKCKSWYPWTEYLTPKEHFDEFKEEINRQERRRTNRIMIWLTIALIFFAIVQVVVTILGVTNNS